MSEYTEPIDRRVQQQRDASKRCYHKKIHENPEFYAAEKLRIKEYKINRYRQTQSFARKLNRLTETIIKKRKRPKQNMDIPLIKSIIQFFIFQLSIYKN